MLPGRRGVRALAGAVSASAVLLLAACGPAGTDAAGQGEGPVGGLVADVDVDTPALRAAKQRAGIADCPVPAGPAPDASEPMPDVTLPCLGGGPDVDLRELHGPMVVNLWAQWCPPCREELPFYQKLHEQADGKVSVLGVEYQDPRPSWALDLLADTGVTYPSVADPGGDLRVPFRVRGLPGVVFLDENGEVVAVEYVAVRSFGELADLVDEHLGVRVGGAG